MGPGLEGTWRVTRLSGLLPPLAGITKVSGRTLGRFLMRRRGR